MKKIPQRASSRKIKPSEAGIQFRAGVEKKKTQNKKRRITKKSRNETKAAMEGGLINALKGLGLK
jgi:hypothetical protein